MADFPVFFVRHIQLIRNSHKRVGLLLAPRYLDGISYAA
jgi:hypothetical protein